jgi:osmotically-inducible protein OsmY
MPIIFDVALTQLIRERLQQDARTAGAMIDVSCTDGAICLIGHADTQEQKEATLFVVKGMIGVRSIMDQIIIRR